MMRLVFLGSPMFAVPTLDAIREIGHEIGLVVTQPDRPAGRGQISTPPAVAAYAHEHTLPVWQTSSLRGAEAEARLRAVNAEAMVLAAFAALVPANILSLAPRGILNVHPSLLPRWRGAAPIQAALAHGDTETGVSIIRLVEALDAGPIFAQQRIPIEPSDDYLSLERRLAARGADMLRHVLATWPEPQPQTDDGVTFAPRIARQDAHIDWSLPAAHIVNRVRAYRAWPQAFTTWQGKLLKVLGASALDAPTAYQPQTRPGHVRIGDGELIVSSGHGHVCLDHVQLEGKRAMTGRELGRGYPSLDGAELA